MDILQYEKAEAVFKPWTPDYFEVANALIALLRTEDLDVIHIGSTAAKIGGKGIIDLSLLYRQGEREVAVEYLYAWGFQDQHSEKPFPSSRPRKDGAVLFNGQRYLLHVHVIEKECEEHHNLLRYKAYMLANPTARAEYEATKQAILAQGVTEQDAYGKLKGLFVKSILNAQV